jgi:hypothetical protein
VIICVDWVLAGCGRSWVAGLCPVSWVLGVVSEAVGPTSTGGRISASRLNAAASWTAKGQSASILIMVRGWPWTIRAAVSGRRAWSGISQNRLVHCVVQHCADNVRTTVGVLEGNAPVVPHSVRQDLTNGVVR